MFNSVFFLRPAPNFRADCTIKEKLRFTLFVLFSISGLPEIMEQQELQRHLTLSRATIRDEQSSQRFVPISSTACGDPGSRGGEERSSQLHSESDIASL
jgi:hypothetical protein